MRGLVRNQRLEVEDILQESLVHAFRSLDGLRIATTSGFLAWFAGIVRNRVACACRLGRERVRPRRDTALPWTLQRGLEPEMLESVGTPEGESRVAEVPLLRTGLPHLSADRRVAVLLRDGFSSTLEVLGLVLDRGSHGGMRRSLREARGVLSPDVST